VGGWWWEWEQVKITDYRLHITLHRREDQGERKEKVPLSLGRKEKERDIS
jgi:hypothetical protein